MSEKSDSTCDDFSLISQCLYLRPVPIPPLARPRRRSFWKNAREGPECVGGACFFPEINLLMSARGPKKRAIENGSRCSLADIRKLQGTRARGGGVTSERGEADAR